MNKKGFTLTELLAVIVIIAVVSLVGTVSISGIKKKIDENMFDSKLQLAIGAAQTWGEDNKELLTQTCTIGGLSRSCKQNQTIKELINANYLEKDDEDASHNPIFNDNYNNNIANNTKLNIYIANGRVYACISSYSAHDNEDIYLRYKCN